MYAHDTDHIVSIYHLLERTITPLDIFSFHQPHYMSGSSRYFGRKMLYMLVIV